MAACSEESCFSKAYQMYQVQRILGKRWRNHDWDNDLLDQQHPNQEDSERSETFYVFCDDDSSFCEYVGTDRSPRVSRKQPRVDKREYWKWYVTTRAEWFVYYSSILYSLNFFVGWVWRHSRLHKNGASILNVYYFRSNRIIWLSAGYHPINRKQPERWWIEGEGGID